MTTIASLDDNNRNTATPFRHQSAASLHTNTPTLSHQTQFHIIRLYRGSARADNTEINNRIVMKLAGPLCLSEWWYVTMVSEHPLPPTGRKETAQVAINKRSVCVSNSKRHDR